MTIVLRFILKMGLMVTTAFGTGYLVAWFLCHYFQVSHCENIPLIAGLVVACFVEALRRLIRYRIRKAIKRLRENRRFANRLLSDDVDYRQVLEEVINAHADSAINDSEVADKIRTDRIWCLRHSMPYIYNTLSTEDKGKVKTLLRIINELANIREVKRQSQGAITRIWKRLFGNIGKEISDEWFRQNPSRIVSPLETNFTIQMPLLPEASNKEVIDTTKNNKDRVLESQ